MPACTPPIEIVPAGVKTRGLSRLGICRDLSSPDRYDQPGVKPIMATR